MRLSVNVDHFATLRQARRAAEPEPVLAALLAEQAGASGVTAHLRSDRRHINERDLRAIREVIKTKLTVEMAATEEMKAVALDIKPDVVCLVPEKPDELTTTGGLDVAAHRRALGPHIRDLAKAGIRVSIFIDPVSRQVEASAALGVPQVEIHTGIYADLRPGPKRDKALAEVAAAAGLTRKLGLEPTAGHGLDYHNVGAVVAIPELTELSIGFSIVARAAIVGVSQAVREMVHLLTRWGTL
jgi:pyridoxine 5-phosphate synthase